MMTHNAEVKLCNLLSIFDVPTFDNNLYLVHAIFIRAQTRFGIGQTIWYHQ